MDKVLIVSADSHAQMPPDQWPEYLDQRYHEYLPRLREENEVYSRAMWLLSSQVMSRPDISEAHRTGGYRGVHDVGVRLAEMDREGISAEIVYIGDHRATDLACNIVNGSYPLEVWHAGACAYDRWAHDEFGSAADRILLVGAIGPCVDMDATLSELDWIADHGFVGTYAPGFITHPQLPPLFDEYWEPFWARCAERGLAVVVHAGYGFQAGATYPKMERIFKEAETSGASEMQLLEKLAIEVFNSEFFSDVKPRRPMWQLMLGGVFDRHPDLRLLLTEVRADWLPATLRHLDAVYEQYRADLPARSKPSEYWRTNCLAGMSFVHKAEVGMRHEIGMETFLFGRDYPHPEGTWPNTRIWLRDAFAGVPEEELRLMLGLNAIRFLGLDRDRLVAVAERIGPSVEDIIGGEREADADLLAHFDLRGGYLKPAEGDSNLAALEPMLREDLARAGVA